MLRDMCHVYRDLREDGATILDAFLLAFGLWVYFHRRYPEVTDEVFPTAPVNATAYPNDGLRETVRTRHQADDVQ